MKKDRFLIGILVFIAVLVVAAVALFFVRGEEQAYGPEDTPDGVLKNYALAIQNMDYERAYTYLAERDGKPTFETFQQSFLTRQLDTSNSTLQIGEVYESGTNSAWAEVSVIYAGTGLFDTGWSSNDRAILVRQDGAWKITYLPYPYWGWEWYTPTPMPVKP
ncbi:MAG: hypothetical protein FD146_208 [Anaerolineaceae bacterium]|nr:MAG: hypothetical protein FD146_208 [Anaerolineaceae bacterium]